MMRRRICIIGGGASGLTSVKTCLEEGLEPVCFEREDDIGGLWNYTEDDRPDKGSVYKSCVINTSKEMMAFSDFPVPADFPPFMPHHYVIKYFRLYVEKFNLLPHIQFNTTVEDVRPASDYDVTGRWHVTYRKSDESQSQVTMETFDGVMVCSGHHVYPHLPQYAGLRGFQGVHMHSKSYKTPTQFTGKRVLVVGIGNSAVDIANDISNVAQQVYLSTRRGAWIVSRMGPLGIPADALANSRFLFSLPMSWLQWMVEVMANFRFDHENYGLKPAHRALQAHPTINDELPYRIMVGKVKVKPDVTRFHADSVTFEDDTTEPIDGVVFASGYNYRYSFLTKDVLCTDDNNVRLYKYMYPPHLHHPSLAVIGLVQAIGAVIPISEMQARWYTQVIKGNTKLPDPTAMVKDIQDKRDAMDHQYVHSHRHTIQTFWISYMDEIASLIGVKPRLRELFLSDPLFALRCYLGPCVPAQYRLMGRAKWSGAKQTIQSAFTNNATATKTRVLKVTSAEMNHVYFKNARDILLVVAMFSAMFLLYYCGILL